MLSQHNSPPAKLPPRADRARLMVRKTLLILFGLGLGLFALCVVAFVVISSRKIEKNIVLIPPISDGKINAFVFASLNIDGRGKSSLVITSVNRELKLTPLSQVLDPDQQSTRLQRAQVSVQTGVLVDEIWSVSQLPTTLSKKSFLDAWKTQDQSVVALQWWETNWLLSERDVEVKTDQDNADLAKMSQVARISPAARKCSVAIVNTTQVAGLASAISDYLEKIGLVVIRVTDNQTNSVASHLVIADKSTEFCQEAIAVLDYISPEPLEVTVNQEAANTYRASLVLLVGQNMIQVQEPAK